MLFAARCRPWSVVRRCCCLGPRKCAIFLGLSRTGGRRGEKLLRSRRGWRLWCGHGQPGCVSFRIETPLYLSRTRESLDSGHVSVFVYLLCVLFSRCSRFFCLVLPVLCTPLPCPVREKFREMPSPHPARGMAWRGVDGWKEKGSAADHLEIYLRAGRCVSRLFVCLSSREKEKKKSMCDVALNERETGGGRRVAVLLFLRLSPIFLLLRAGRAMRKWHGLGSSPASVA